MNAPKTDIASDAPEQTEARGHAPKEVRSPADIFMGQLKRLDWENKGTYWAAKIKPQHAHRFHRQFDELGLDLGFIPEEHKASHVFNAEYGNGFELRVTEGEMNRSGLAAHLKAKENGANGQMTENALPRDDREWSL